MVVDVVLAVHRVPGRIEQVCDGRPERRTPAVTDVQRSGRVGGHELDHRAPAAAQLTATIRGPGLGNPQELGVIRRRRR